MNILLVQDHLRAGGAARAAGRWAELLRERGHEVTQAAGDEGGQGAVLVSGKPPRGLGRLSELVFGKASSRAARLQNAFRSLLQSQPWDLVWIHNLAGGQKWGWGTEMVRAARQRAPVFWTLHDMWALGDDDRSFWQEPGDAGGGRGQSSRIGQVCGEDGKFPVTLTAPSRWLADLAKQRTGKDCLLLPNPIDLNLFSPGDRREARRRLGLPEEGILILAGADSLEDRRKGFDLLSEAWCKAGSGKGTLVLFGGGRVELDHAVVLGALRSDEQMIAAYRAANLYVHTARQENAPCTIQESLACGTPVLAFGVGGIPEMIRPGRNGFLVQKLDGPALADGLRKTICESQLLEAMGPGCRELAERDYGPETLMKKIPLPCGEGYRK